MQFELLPPVAAIQLVRRLREIPLFRFASIDELFRISAISRQARYPERSQVQRVGATPEYIQVLLEGSFLVRDDRTEPRTVAPPTLLGFREVLSGTPLQEDALAHSESVALVMPAEEFRVLLAANIELAQGLFRMLLEDAPASSSMSTSTGTGTNGGGGRSLGGDGRLAATQGTPLRTVDKMMLLQGVPIFSRATAEEMYALATIARERPLETGASVFSSGAPASILLVVSGEIAIEPSASTSTSTSPSTSARDGVVKAGDVLGVNETFAGASWTSSATVVRPGVALVVERDRLFDLLSDRMDLLQGIFSSVFHRRETAAGTSS